jgi:AraC-like DNA-binding protein
MTLAPRRSLDLLFDTLRFEYVGGERQVWPDAHSTGWRELPFAVCAHIRNAVLRVTRHDGSFFDVHDGETFLLHVGVRNRVDKISAGILRSRFSHFRVTAFGSLDVLSLLEMPEVLPKSKSGPFAKVLGELVDTQLADGTFPLRRIARHKSLGFELTSLIAEVSPLRASAHRLLGDVERLAPAFAAIHDNPAHPFTVDELADRVHLSRSRFHSFFKQALGVAPMKYVQRMRMDRAQELLLTTDHPVKTIATLVGSEDPFHFSRLFKKVCGMGPQQYRQEVKKGLAPGP